MKSQVFTNAGIEAAKVAGLDPEMDAVAARMAAAIRLVAARHRRTGSYDASVRVVLARGKRGVKDRLVEVTDPAAEHIEYGHMAERADGAAVYIHGTRIVTRAFEAIR